MRNHEMGPATNAGNQFRNYRHSEVQKFSPLRHHHDLASSVKAGSQIGNYRKSEVPGLDHHQYPDMVFRTIPSESYVEG